MDAKAVALGTAVIAVMLFVLIFSAAFRWSNQRHIPMILLGSVLAAFCLTFAIAYSAVSFWHLASFFAGGVAASIFIFGAVWKSLSIEMLRMLMTGRQIAIREIVEEVVRPWFKHRAEQKAASGLVTRRCEGGNTTYRVTATGRARAGLILAIQQAFCLGGPALYRGSDSG